MNGGLCKACAYWFVTYPCKIMPKTMESSRIYDVSPAKQLYAVRFFRNSRKLGVLVVHR